MAIFAMNSVNKYNDFSKRYEKPSIEQELSEGKHYFYANLDAHQEVIFQVNKTKLSLDIIPKKIIRGDKAVKQILKSYKAKMYAKSSKEDVIEYLRKISSYKNVYYLEEDDLKEYL